MIFRFRTNQSLLSMETSTGAMGSAAAPNHPMHSSIFTEQLPTHQLLVPSVNIATNIDKSQNEKNYQV